MSTHRALLPNYNTNSTLAEPQRIQKTPKHRVSVACEPCRIKRIKVSGSHSARAV